MESKMRSIYEAADKKFFEQFEFHIRDTNIRNIAAYMYRPTDASSLAVTRILFGIAMLFDIPDERGGAIMTDIWGNPSICHFPLLPYLDPLPMPQMAVMYLGLWLGALGIALGLKFRLCTVLFSICYWYLLLIDKSYWNNHSYLFGLVALLLTFTQANCYWSLDAIVDKSESSQTVPYWNYFILKYQFFILYFMAGVKKGSTEWLSGYSVPNLSEHWVFSPIKLFLTVPQTDYLIVHWFVFVFDLTVAFWMMWSRTRHIAMIFCALFHLMNIRLFKIGMFPWVCLATMPLFYPFHWPKLVMVYYKNVSCGIKTRILKWVYVIKYKRFPKNDNIDVNVKNDGKDEDTAEETSGCSPGELDNQIATGCQESDATSENNDYNETETEISKPDIADKEKIDERNKMLTCILIGFYLITQAFLPFSHFITKGYNNWTNGLYGYSWDMMVHTWDLHSVTVKVVDNVNNIEFFVDPYHFTSNDRWTRHGDMVHQYARCLKDKMLKESKRECRCSDSQNYLQENISIYIDVWTSLNGRFVQRMFDPKIDILNASWSPFSSVSYLMPLIDEGLNWREHLLKLKEAVYSWNNRSEVLFLADFPGYQYEKYIPTELKNVTLTVLDGVVVYEPEAASDVITKSYELRMGNRMGLPSGIFHKVINTGNKPAFYMYTFYNSMAADDENYKVAPKLPLIAELFRRFNNMARFLKNILFGCCNFLLNMSECQ